MVKNKNIILALGITYPEQLRFLTNRNKSNKTNTNTNDNIINMRQTQGNSS